MGNIPSTVRTFIPLSNRDSFRAHAISLVPLICNILHLTMRQLLGEILMKYVLYCSFLVGHDYSSLPPTISDKTIFKLLNGFLTTNNLSLKSQLFS